LYRYNYPHQAICFFPSHLIKNYRYVHNSYRPGAAGELAPVYPAGNHQWLCWGNHWPGANAAPRAGRAGVWPGGPHGPAIFYCRFWRKQSLHQLLHRGLGQPRREKESAGVRLAFWPAGSPDSHVCSQLELYRVGQRAAGH